MEMFSTFVPEVQSDGHEIKGDTVVLEGIAGLFKFGAMT